MCLWNLVSSIKTETRVVGLRQYDAEESMWVEGSVNDRRLDK